MVAHCATDCSLSWSLHRLLDALLSELLALKQRQGSGSHDGVHPRSERSAGEHGSGQQQPARDEDNGDPVHVAAASAASFSGPLRAVSPPVANDAPLSPLASPPTPPRAVGIRADALSSPFTTDASPSRSPHDAAGRRRRGHRSRGEAGGTRGVQQLPRGAKVVAQVHVGAGFVTTSREGYVTQSPVQGPTNHRAARSRANVGPPSGHVHGAHAQESEPGRRYRPRKMEIDKAVARVGGGAATLTHAPPLPPSQSRAGQRSQRRRKRRPGHTVPHAPTLGDARNQGDAALMEAWVRGGNRRGGSGSGGGRGRSMGNGEGSSDPRSDFNETFGSGTAPVDGGDMDTRRRSGDQLHGGDRVATQPRDSYDSIGSRQAGTFHLLRASQTSGGGGGRDRVLAALWQGRVSMGTSGGCLWYS